MKTTPKALSAGATKPLGVVAQKMLAPKQHTHKPTGRGRSNMTHTAPRKTGENFVLR